MKAITKLSTPRTVLLPDIDRGDGQRITCWLTFARTGAWVRRYGSSKTLAHLSMRELAKLVLRRGQVLEANKILSTPDVAEGEAGPLFDGRA